MARVFISYRRQDSEPYAAALRDELERSLGAGSVFVDSSSVDYGDAFPDRIESALGAARVCLVLIARRWLTVVDADGIPRLKRDDDWVRREVKEALTARDAGRMRGIPVLLRDSRVPRADELPEDIRGLATLNGFALGSVALDGARLGQTDTSKAMRASPRRVRWGVVIPVLLTMIAADALAVLTSPLYSGSPNVAARLLMDAKDAWNSAIFFGLVAAVIAWRRNAAMREDEVHETRPNSGSDLPRALRTLQRL